MQFSIILFFILQILHCMHRPLFELQIIIPEDQTEFTQIQTISESLRQK